MPFKVISKPVYSIKKGYLEGVIPLLWKEQMDTKLAELPPVWLTSSYEWHPWVRWQHSKGNCRTRELSWTLGLQNTRPVASALAMQFGEVYGGEGILVWCRIIKDIKHVGKMLCFNPLRNVFLFISVQQKNVFLHVILYLLQSLKLLLPGNMSFDLSRDSEFEEEHWVQCSVVQGRVKQWKQKLRPD